MRAAFWLLALFALAVVLTLVAVPLLSYIGGSLAVESTELLTAISLPSLLVISGSLRIASNNLLTSVSAPLLINISYSQPSTSPYAVYICMNGNDIPLPNNIQYAAAGLPCVLASPCSAQRCVSRTSRTDVADLNDTVTATTFTQYDAILGDVFVHFSAITSVYAPTLTLVRGSLVFAANAALTALNFPQLTYAATVSVEGNLGSSGSNTALQYILLPQLAYVLGPVSIRNSGALNTNLTLIFLPRLSYIGAYVSISANTALTRLDLPSLVTVVGRFEVSGCQALTFLGTPALTRVVNHLNQTDWTVKLCPGNTVLSFQPTLERAAAGLGHVCIFPNDCLSVLCELRPFGTYPWSLVNNATAAMLAGYAAVTGTISFQSSTLTAIVAPQLTMVGGSIDIWNCTAVTVVSFPVLARVGGSITVGCDAVISGIVTLALIHLPALVSIGGMLYVVNQGGAVQPSALTVIALAALAIVGSSTVVSDDATLVQLVMPSLAIVKGALSVQRNAVLTVVSMPLLSHVGGSVLFTANAQLLLINMPSIRTVVPCIAWQCNTLDLCGNNINVHWQSALSAAPEGGYCRLPPFCLRQTCKQFP